MRISADDRYKEMPRQMKINIDRCTQSESDVDRHNTPPIDRQAPLTYRVRLPSIDNDYINALRPPPKPLANPPEPKPNPLTSSTESVQEEQESEGRRLRKRKEKIPKNLKREANDKEMDEYESEYELEYSESIDTPTFPSIDSNVSMVTNDHNNTSLGVMHPLDHFASPNHCYQHFASQPPTKRGHDDYSIGSWADSGFHEIFVFGTVITSPHEEHTEEYDEDYWKERAIEMSLPDERLEIHKFNNKFPTSFDAVHSTSVDTHPRPAKQPHTSIDTPKRTSIDIRAAAKIQEQENILSLTRKIHEEQSSQEHKFCRNYSAIDRSAEVDKITSKIYTALDNMEERLDKRCDDIYFPFDNKISGLDNHAEWLQKEVKAIQRQLTAQHQISASIDRTKAKSVDSNSPRSTNEHIIASIDAESATIGELLIHKTVESMQKKLTDLSAYAYDNIGWHQVSIDNIQERLQNISNVLGKMDDKWTRNDEATRNSTKDAKADQPINYTLALNRMK
ncbi:hypothetical protein F2Q70_00021733 [Brassica cretica]|uniref:Uncharacterized protein n=1 Tax=Brassica cretica TaxID=69181 RepID=A0A8S9GKC5_BRACR|nr:hypothetical protein F2Q70_00021733 [Brassica cretica]